MARDPRATVLAYIAAAQRVRATRSEDDMAALRELVTDDLEVRLASPWTEEPWVTTVRGADALVERLQAPINSAHSLTTENTVVLAEGDQVFVEQRSTVATPSGARVSAVGHLFRVVGGRVHSISTFRNDRDLPVA